MGTSRSIENIDIEGVLVNANGNVASETFVGGEVVAVPVHVANALSLSVRALLL